MLIASMYKANQRWHTAVPLTEFTNQNRKIRQENYLEILLDLISMRVRVVSLHSNSKHVLVPIDEHVGCSSKSRVRQRQGQRGNHRNTRGKLLNQVIISEVKHLRAEDRPTIIDIGDHKTV
jgi:hypothetical protein